MGLKNDKNILTWYKYIYKHLSGTTIQKSTIASKCNFRIMVIRNDYSRFSFARKSNCWNALKSLVLSIIRNYYVAVRTHRYSDNLKNTTMGNQHLNFLILVIY